MANKGLWIVTFDLWMAMTFAVYLGIVDVPLGPLDGHLGTMDGHLVTIGGNLGGMDGYTGPLMKLKASG